MFAAFTRRCARKFTSTPGANVNFKLAQMPNCPTYLEDGLLAAALLVALLLPFVGAEARLLNPLC